MSVCVCMGLRVTASSYKRICATWGMLSLLWCCLFSKQANTQNPKPNQKEFDSTFPHKNDFLELRWRKIIPSPQIRNSVLNSEEFTTGLCCDLGINSLDRAEVLSFLVPSTRALHCRINQFHWGMGQSMGTPTCSCCRIRTATSSQQVLARQ